MGDCEVYCPRLIGVVRFLRKQSVFCFYFLGFSPRAPRESGARQHRGIQNFLVFLIQEGGGEFKPNTLGIWEKGS